MFNYYAKKYSDKPADFDQIQNVMFLLSLRGYIALIKDMGIPIEKTKVIEVWKKSAVNNQPHSMQQFETSLHKIAPISVKQQID